MIDPKRRLSLPFALCLVMLLCARTALAATAESSASGPSAAEVARLVDGVLARTNTPGMVVAMSAPDMARPLVVARGLAQVENAVPLRADAVLRFGSVTKVFTALRVKDCIDAGKLAWDTDVRRYFPELLSREPITVRQLLTHTSGLPELLAQPEVLANPAKQWSKEELLALMARKPMLFAPGTRQVYNNTGYFLLGLLLDKIDASESAWLARERKALGMPSLRVADDASVVPRMAGGYTLTPGKALARPVFFSASLAYGSGDLEGDAADLLHLTGLLARRGLLPENPAPLTLADGTPAVKRASAGDVHYSWSLLAGVSLYDLGGGRAYLGKSGMFPGFASQYFYDPQTKTTVVILLNQETASQGAIRLGLRLLDARRAAAQSGGRRG